MASPKSTVTTDMTAFALRLTRYNNLMSLKQKEQIRINDRVIQKALIEASRSASGGKRRLSRVGGPAGFEKRKGSFLGYKRTHLLPSGFEYSKTGAWQFRDSTVTSGPTQPHNIGPDNKANPRPLPPAKIKRPTMRGVNDGMFLHGPGGYVVHPGSPRRVYWGRAAWQSSTRRMKLTGLEFQKVGRQVWP